MRHEIYLLIEKLVHKSGPAIIAIDGNCAAGKTTLASVIADKFDCNVFHMDDYYLPDEKRTVERLEEAGGNVDRERFREEIIAGILRNKDFSYRRFDCKTQSLLTPVKVSPRKLNIVEGAYSMHPDLANYYDLKIFLALDFEEQSRRILLRNGPVVHERFMNQWIPLENRYFNELNIKENCHIVINTSLLGNGFSNKLLL